MACLQTYERQQIPGVSGGWAHAPWQGSNMHNKVIVNSGQGGDNMDNKIIVKRGQRKGPGDFSNIVSALVPGANPCCALCVSCFLCSGSAHSFQVFLVIFIIEEWLLFDTYTFHPEQVGREIVFTWTHLGEKCTKFTMKYYSTINIDDGFLFKNLCNMYPLFQWENSWWLALGHVAIWVRTGHCHITTHLIHYLILPGTLKIQITENSFWVQGPTFMNPPFGASREPQITEESESGFHCDNKYVVL